MLILEANFALERLVRVELRCTLVYDEDKKEAALQSVMLFNNVVEEESRICQVTQCERYLCPILFKAFRDTAFEKNSTYLM